MTDYPTVTISPAVHRPSLSLPLPDRKLASKAPLCEGEETRSSITRSSSPGYEWANSDPPIQRPASFPHNKLFLPVAVRPRRGCLCNQVLTNAEVPSPYSAEDYDLDDTDDCDSPFNWTKFDAFDRFRFDAVGVCKSSGQHIIIDGDTRRLINSQSRDYSEETDAFRSYWDPSNYEAWRNRRMETRHRSMRSTSSTIKYNPWPYAVRRAERRAHNAYKARAYLSWKDWLRENASG
ncbi:hypothetical protein FOZ62_008432, partial [Perkinsus olseni]